jgi:hypothetical protein
MNAEKLKWLNTHVALMLSDRERLLQGNNGNFADQDVLVNVKGTLHTLFNRVAGTQGPKSTVFGLTEPSKGGIYTLIFVTNLRLDLASHTIVADAYVLPLTESLIPTLFRSLDKLERNGLVQIITAGEEMLAWKRLLPAFTERCREWNHKMSCEYLQKGVVPLSLEIGASPICGCGKGQNVNAFRKVKAWKDLTQYVTRAAFGPLFAVSYLENVATLPEGIGKDDPAEMSQLPDKCAECGGPGKPKLLLCSKCKAAKYCSSTCQKKGWKSHKIQCKGSSR